MLSSPKTRIVLLVMSLIFGLTAVMAPANAADTVTPSGTGTYTFPSGYPITPITFTKSGDVIAGGWRIGNTGNPLFPGLTLDVQTGTISGTPDPGESSVSGYTVDVVTTFISGDVTTQITLNITPSLKTLTQSLTLTAGVPMTPSAVIFGNGFVEGGPAITFDVLSGSIPSGLTLNTGNGQITGTPQLAQPLTKITLRASQGSRTATTDVNITINATLTPATQNTSGVTGTAITPTSRFSTAGLSGLITYAISPALPTGLTMDVNTGVISGTPTAALAATTYTITATDSLTRTATSSVSITITAATITPATQTVTATAGTAITSTTAFTPTGFTGTVSYAISPTIPAGLAFSTTTGVISGTPTTNQAATVYTVTATGATSGTATATITISVAARLTPATQTYTYPAATAITPTTTMTAAGFTGTVVYSVSPALPAGLSLNTTNGVITGTPTLAQAATTYTITGTGTTAGSTVGSGVATATVSITIGAAITPTTRSINLTQNVLMTPSSAYTLSGFSGTITYAINPALPAGLTFNTTTGIITGAPTVLVAPTSHTITVTGSVVGSATTTITLSVLAPLPAPTGVTATAGDKSANISWNAVVGATSYLVTSEPVGAVCAITATQAVCSNLTNGTRYAFRVTAVNAAGPAALSTLSSSVTPKAPFTTVTGKVTITYSVSGTVVPSASLIKLRAIGTQFKADKGTSAVISVRGFTTKNTATALEKRLAATRATLVTRALRAAGLRGQYTTNGDATTTRTGVQARKVVVKYTYQAPND